MRRRYRCIRCGVLFARDQIFKLKKNRFICKECFGEIIKEKCVKKLEEINNVDKKTS